MTLISIVEDNFQFRSTEPGWAWAAKICYKMPMTLQKCMMLKKLFYGLRVTKRKQPLTVRKRQKSLVESLLLVQAQEVVINILIIFLKFK